MDTEFPRGWMASPADRAAQRVFRSNVDDGQQRCVPR